MNVKKKIIIGKLEIKGNIYIYIQMLKLTKMNM